MSSNPTPAEHLGLARLVYENGDYLRAAAEAAMASAGLLQALTESLAGVSGPEPRWQRHDVVRRRIPVHNTGESFDVFAYFLLQRPDEDSPPGWWHAQVLRADEAARLQVGQSVRVREGSLHTAAARFPD